ncbi:MAG: hypothetical protein JZU65_08545 [Chlorobium sp.]|nr:hypothetical protein [Chlorobium sp.]
MGFNLWATFKRLLPNTPTTVGVVASIDTVNGTSMVTVSGGNVRVIGKEFAVGKSVFVRNGAILEEAPSLPFYNLEV